MLVLRSILIEVVVVVEVVYTSDITKDLSSSSALVLSPPKNQKPLLSLPIIISPSVHYTIISGSLPGPASKGTIDAPPNSQVFSKEQQEQTPATREDPHGDDDQARNCLEIF